MNIKNMSLKKIILANFLLLLLFGGFLFTNRQVFSAQTNLSDAIAVRIIPNPNHLSAQRWYESQGFSGSPQSLIVDGYKAVRDGRTVYVSATNITGNNLYTNIYLISYNQEADAQTVDIFGRILKSWSFNTNIESNVGTCSIPNKSCKQNSDCSSDFICSDTGSTKNKCILELENPADMPNCVIDSECPSGVVCSSLKAKIIRDLDRLEKLMMIEDKLNKYKSKNGVFPILGAGTYLPHVAISTWPSWQNIFLNQIEANNALDPINKLGSCVDADGKFNLDTCWNAVDNVFYNAISYSNFLLPADSYAVAYVSNPNGSDYKLCANMETKNNNYQVVDGALANHSCALASSGNIGTVGSSVNNAPYVAESLLTGQSGQEFSGLIKVADAEGHPISWNLNFGATNFSSWSGTPVLTNTGNPNQKMLKATTAGTAGTYNFVLNISDNLGSSTSKTLTITIDNDGPQIIAGDINYNISYGVPFLADVAINSVNSIQSLSVCKSNSAGVCSPAPHNVSVTNQCSGTTALEDGFKVCLKNNGNGRYVLQISGDPQAGPHYNKITVKDSYDRENSVVLKTNVTVDTPVINFNNCSTLGNLGDYYECELKTVNPLGTSTFSVLSSLPKGLTFNSSTKKISGNLLELVSDKEIKVRVVQFGQTVEKSFKLNIISDCEDSLVSAVGGPWNYSGTVRDHSGYYKTTLIGNQCWMADNLNVGNFSTSTTVVSDSVVEKYCLGSDSMNCDIYGGLYNFYESLKMPNDCLSNSTPSSCTSYGLGGICPTGFRVPTDSDWYILEKKLNNIAASTCLDNRQMPIGAMSVNDASWGCANTGSRIKVGGDSRFNALTIALSSISASKGTSGNVWDNYVNFWSGSLLNNNFSISRHLSSSSTVETIAKISSDRQNKYSIRCIKNIPQCQQASDCSYLGANYNCVTGICAKSGTISGNGGALED